MKTFIRMGIIVLKISFMNVNHRNMTLGLKTKFVTLTSLNDNFNTVIS